MTTASTQSPAPPAALAGGLEVRGVRFFRDGRPFFIHGMNHWAASTLARDPGPGWDRVRRDLDDLQALGVNAIRTMAATEGPHSEPWRIVPATQPAAGRHDPDGVAGVERLASELQRRGLVGVFVLNNFWPWSGGMAQYLAWAGEGPIPYPPPQPHGAWDRYQRFTAGFYANERARAAFRDCVRHVVPRLADNPAIVWELANEPRGVDRATDLRSWIDESARLVKSLAPGQLVTTGSEGQTATPGEAGLDVVADHASASIDFATCHVWAQNWGWARPDRLADDHAAAVELACAYVRDHAALADRIGKPILVEEFGFPRDGASFDPEAPTTLRDRYFDRLYALVHALTATTPMAGIMPWCWSGRAVPPRPGGYWRPGDPLCGDPPHEAQGWYGIYAHDATLDVIRGWSSRITRGVDP